MPITVGQHLQTVDANPPVLPPGTPITARFNGGSQHGREMAVQDARPVLEFPVYNQTMAAYTAADPTIVPPLSTFDTEIYRATARTITAERPVDWTITDSTIITGNTIYPMTAATNYTIQIEYTAAGTVTDNYTANGTWLGHRGNLNVQPLYSLDPPTPEQQAAQARKWARTERRRVLAHKRARRLLLNLLSEQQQEEYAKSKTFTVVAKNGKVFRLRKGKTAELLGSDGVAIAAYCIHLPYGYNHEDTLVALLLSLQTDPAEFERIANITRLQRPIESPSAPLFRAARQDEIYRRQHVAESRAILRSEGLSVAEVEALRDPPNHRSGILVAAA